MKTKYIIPIMLVCLLILPMVMGSMEKISDIKDKKYTISDDGIYLNEVKIKDKEKSEIWIDKKIGNTYHVDSVIDDVIVYMKLFYDIQPDTIDYRSHNGKYQNVYTYNDWIWEDKLDCGEEEYCGGYVILEVTLEQGQGSNTFTDAISGATWMNDGVDVTLTSGTDYILSGKQFTISNMNYAWSGINTSYSYEVEKATTISTSNLRSNFTAGIDNVSNKIPIIFSIGIMVILIGVLLLLIPFYKKFSNGGGI